MSLEILSSEPAQGERVTAAVDNLEEIRRNFLEDCERRELALIHLTPEVSPLFTDHLHTLAMICFSEELPFESRLEKFKNLSGILIKGGESSVLGAFCAISPTDRTYNQEMDQHLLKLEDSLGVQTRRHVVFLAVHPFLQQGGLGKGLAVLGSDMIKAEHPEGVIMTARIGIDNITSQRTFQAANWRPTEASEVQATTNEVMQYWQRVYLPY